MQELDEAEWCRRALRLGLADYPEKLKAFIELADEAEARRPVCLQCGAKLKFGAVQWLDNSRFADTVSRGFVVLPARCPGCGRLELYDPDFIHNDPQLSYLLRADETN